MAFIKEESEDMKIEETFRVKQEDTEEQTGSHTLKRTSDVEAYQRTAEMRGNTRKLCTGCNTLISVAYKTCPLCKQLQPYKAKVAARRCDFQKKKSDWKNSVKKNNNRTVVLNSSHLLLDKLAALDFFPILLLGKKLKGSLVADVILGGDYLLDPDLLQRVKMMYEAVLKIHFQRQKKATSSTETADPSENTVADATSPSEDNGTDATSLPEGNGTDATSPLEHYSNDATSLPEDNGIDCTSPLEDNGTDATSLPEGNGNDATSPPESNGSDATSLPEVNGTDATSPLEDNGTDATSLPEGNGTDATRSLEDNGTDATGPLQDNGTDVTSPSEANGIDTTGSTEPTRTPGPEGQKKTKKSIPTEGRQQDEKKKA
ncbi:hypothetical protein QQF64_035806 [Cirrhinus molitorella]|uniref:Uncharacterized protein n=1 Tax=Cirrhinus molitorella TaxID=172907 RepID=A0ABR3NGT4_9TELE